METQLLATTYDCSVCAESLPIAAYDYTLIENLLPECIWHLMPTTGKGPVCTACLSAYAEMQYRLNGTNRWYCIDPSCWRSVQDYSVYRPIRFGAATIQEYDVDGWRNWAHFFLPADVREQFYEDAAQEWYKRHRWVCPNDCGCGTKTEGWVLEPGRASGYPHVVCPECQERFCAVCRVEWHQGQTCQQWQKENGDRLAGRRVVDEQQAMSLETMTHMGARLWDHAEVVASNKSDKNDKNEDHVKGYEGDWFQDNEHVFGEKCEMDRLAASEAKRDS